MIVLRLVAAAILAGALGACASSPPANDFEMSITDGNLDVALSRDLVVSMLADSLDAELDCGGDLDGDLRRLLEPLAQKSRGRTSMRQDGDRVIVVRRGSRLTFKIDDDGGGRLEASIPWAVGQCLLGCSTSLDEAIGSGPIELTVVTDGGRRLTARLQ